MAARKVRTMQGDTVDLLCLRHLGTTGNGVVEATHAANPGLAALGPVLPTGVLVTLAEAPQTSATTRTINIWD
ncbi:MAG: tail protein X [Burkholderiales bacterium]|nr:tail protein X [Burkholderiales bacterium]